MPQVLAGGKNLHNGLYAHRGLTAEPPINDRGRELLLPLPGMSVLTACRVMAKVGNHHVASA
jgi:hypothetical protein